MATSTKSVPDFCERAKKVLPGLQCLVLAEWTTVENGVEVDYARYQIEFHAEQVSCGSSHYRYAFTKLYKVVVSEYNVVIQDMFTGMEVLRLCEVNLNDLLVSRGVSGLYVKLLVSGRKA